MSCFASTCFSSINVLVVLSDFCSLVTRDFRRSSATIEVRSCFRNRLDCLHPGLAGAPCAVKAHANRRNKSQHSCISLGGFGQQCCVLCLTGFKLYATSANIVVVPCKRTQHVGPNNVVCCWPTMSGCVRLHGP